MVFLKRGSYRVIHAPNRKVRLNGFSCVVSLIHSICANFYDYQLDWQIHPRRLIMKCDVNSCM